MATILRLWTAVALQVLLAEGSTTNASCTNRRCLAEMLANKELMTQPQNDNCTHTIKVRVLEYQTLSVNTKQLMMKSRMVATIVWTDSDLSWNTSIYPHEKVVLPVSKVWTPWLYVANGLTSTLIHTSHDLLVYSNGTVLHRETIIAEVNCEVNLFNYPFIEDACPVAVTAWRTDDCGMTLEMGRLRLLGSNHGDWRTSRVSLAEDEKRRQYVLVFLSTKSQNPFITLLLPTILIMVADVMSFSLPFEGGERNTFKVTLVLSFIMFLLILNSLLPGDGLCSPVIRYHFCCCLTLLVISMLLSVMLTRLANDGTLIFYSKNKKIKSSSSSAAVEEIRTEPTEDVNVVPLEPRDEVTLLRKVLLILEALHQKEQRTNKYQDFANTLDKIIFWVYGCIVVLYFVVIFILMTVYRCNVNHFDFW